jgi:hypothetical protein
VTAIDSTQGGGSARALPLNDEIGASIAVYIADRDNRSRRWNLKSDRVEPYDRSCVERRSEKWKGQNSGQDNGACHGKPHKKPRPHVETPASCYRGDTP